VEGSTFPNFDGADQKRSFTLAGDELRYTNPVGLEAGQVSGALGILPNREGVRPHRAADPARPPMAAVVFFDFPEFSKKWLELMKETLPQLAKIGVLRDLATGFTQLRAIEAASGIMNLKLQIVEVRALAELDEAMVAASQGVSSAEASERLLILRCSVACRRSRNFQILLAVAG
jgi:hypothetical protein